jgi:hypothetical protein
LRQPLGEVDEHYHLSRFLAYFSPYIHGIDPPINLGKFEPKYALHSRCWHYFAPPMLSASTLLARRHFESKRAGLMWLAENGFAASQVLAVLEQVDAHYDTAEQTDETRLARFEQHLFAAFEELLGPVRDAIQSLDLSRTAAVAELQSSLCANAMNPLVELLDAVRFARIRAGRYYFYLNAPSHFEAHRQLIGEHGWTKKLTGTIFSSLRRIIGMQHDNAVDSILQLGIETTDSEFEALAFMLQLSKLKSSDPELRNAYQEAIDWYPDFYRLIERALQRVLSEEPTSISNTSPTEIGANGESQNSTAPSRSPMAGRSKP